MGTCIQVLVYKLQLNVPPPLYPIILRQFEVLMLFLGIFLVLLLMLFFIEILCSLYHGINLVENADALFRNIPINFWLMLFLLTLMVPWYKAMKMLINCLSVSIKKNPKSIFSQNQSHQPQFVGQSLDTCIHQPPRSPHMKQSLVHMCLVSTKVGQNTMS